LSPSWPQKNRLMPVLHFLRLGCVLVNPGESPEENAP